MEAYFHRRRIVTLILADELFSFKEKDYWIHPYYYGRRVMKFKKFYDEIRLYEHKFFNYYRMSKNSFNELLQTLRPQIQKKDTHWRDPISAEERLTVTLR